MTLFDASSQILSITSVFLSVHHACTFPRKSPHQGTGPYIPGSQGLLWDSGTDSFLHHLPRGKPERRGICMCNSNQKIHTKVI